MAGGRMGAVGAKPATAGGGSATTPVQRGAVVSKTWGSPYPVSAPAGLTEGDIVIMAITQEVDTNPRSLSGFTALAEFDNGSQYVTILQGVMGASPPTDWTVTNGIANEEVLVMAWSGATTTGQAVGTPNTTAPGGSNPVLGGVTAAPASIGVTLTVTQSDVTAVTDMTELGANGPLNFWTGEFDDVVIGSQTVTLANTFATFFLGVVFTIPGE